MLADVILVDHEPSALDHGPRHFEILCPQVEVSQQRDEVGRQHGTDSGVDRYFLEAKTAVVNRLTYDFVESAPCHLELPIAEINNAFIEPIHDLQVEFLTTLIPLLLVCGQRYFAEFHFKISDEELLAFVIE